MGDQIELLLSRENRMFSETVTLEKQKSESWSIRWASDSNEKVNSRIREWLNLPAPVEIKEPEESDEETKDAEEPKKKKKKKRKRRTRKPSKKQ